MNGRLFDLNRPNKDILQVGKVREDRYYIAVGDNSIPVLFFFMNKDELTSLRNALNLHLNPTINLHTQSEIAFLKNELKEIPEDARLTRMSIEARIKELETYIPQDVDF